MFFSTVMANDFKIEKEKLNEWIWVKSWKSRGEWMSLSHEYGGVYLGLNKAFSKG